LFAAGDNRPVYGIRLGFRNITGSNRMDTCECPSNCHVDVTDLSTRQVRFTFTNREPDNCCITEVYLNDGDLLSIAVQIVSETDASEDPSNSLSPDYDHESAPRPYHDSTTFQAVRSRIAAADPEAIYDGICRNESLGIVFDLQAGISFADIINALSGGKLNIGIKLQNAEAGGSILCINTPQLALSPASPEECSRAIHPAGPETGISD
jgi:hypothetical protein